jgi:hypothetical protein
VRGACQCRRVEIIRADVAELCVLQRNKTIQINFMDTEKNMSALSLSDTYPQSNSPGFRMPSRISKGDDLSAYLGALDQAVSFILTTTFDDRRSKLEARLACGMFSTEASVVLVPRGRPTLAYAVDVGTFLAKDREVLKYKKGWRESSRQHELPDQGNDKARISVQITLDADDHARFVEATFFVLNAFSPARQFSACTLVYDEAYDERSPATLYCKRPLL